jgi:hypothetical protein
MRQITIVIVAFFVLTIPARAYSEAGASAFRKADANGDGVISVEELQAKR